MIDGPVLQRMKVFSHPDGGLYVRVEETQDCHVKMDDGSWQPAVHYRPITIHGERLAFANRKMFTTTAARWGERFTEIDRGKK